MIEQRASFLLVAVATLALAACGDDDPFSSGRQEGPELDGRFRATTVLDPDDVDLLGAGWTVAARFFRQENGDFFRIAAVPPDTAFSPGIFWEGTYQTGGDRDIVLFQQVLGSTQLLAGGKLEVKGEALEMDFGGKFVLDSLRLEPAPEPVPESYVGSWSPVDVTVSDEAGRTTRVVPGDGSFRLSFSVEGRYNIQDFVVPVGDIYPGGGFASYNGGWDLVGDVILLDEGFGCNAWVGKVTGTSSPFGFSGVACDLEGKRVRVDASFEAQEG